MTMTAAGAQEKSIGRRRQKSDNHGPLKLWVGGLPRKMKEQDLLPTFTPFGPIQRFKLVYYTDPRRPTDCAFVTFQYAEDARRAQATLNGSMIVIRHPDNDEAAAEVGPIRVRVSHDQTRGERSQDEEKEEPPRQSSSFEQQQQQSPNEHNKDTGAHPLRRDDHRDGASSSKNNKAPPYHGDDMTKPGSTRTSSSNRVLLDATHTAQMPQTRPWQGERQEEGRLSASSSSVDPLTHNNDSQQKHETGNKGNQNLGNEKSHHSAEDPELIHNNRASMSGHNVDELTMLSNLSKKLQHNKELESTNEDLKGKLAQEQHKNETAEATLKAFEKELATLKTRNQWIEHEHEALVMQVQQLQEEKETLHQQARATHEELEREATEAKYQVEQLQQELCELRQTRDGVQDMQGSARERLKARVEEAVRLAFEEEPSPIKQEST